MTTVRRLIRDIPDAPAEKNAKFYPIEDLPAQQQTEVWLAKLQEELDGLKAAASSQDEAKMLEEILDLSMFLHEYKDVVDPGWVVYNRMAREKYAKYGGVDTHTVMESEEPAEEETNHCGCPCMNCSGCLGSAED